MGRRSERRRAVWGHWEFVAQDGRKFVPKPQTRHLVNFVVRGSSIVEGKEADILFQCVNETNVIVATLRQDRWSLKYQGSLLIAQVRLPLPRFSLDKFLTFRQLYSNDVELLLAAALMYMGEKAWSG